jgi:hypothetical protein
MSDSKCVRPAYRKQGPLPPCMRVHRPDAETLPTDIPFRKQQLLTITTPSPEMAPQLPVELVEQWFSFVEDQTTRAAVCRTWFLGNRLAKPMLYRTIGFRDLRRNDRRRLVCLVRSLLENPALADHVMTFHHYFDPDRDPPFEQGAGVRRTFARLIYPIFLEESAGDVAASRIESDLLHAVPENAVEDTCAILAILLCPRLHTLKFSGDLTRLFDMRSVQGLSLEGNLWTMGEKEGPCHSIVSPTI